MRRRLWICGFAAPLPPVSRGFFRSLLRWAALALLAIPTVALAQGRPGPTFRDAIEVNVVNLDVHVLDRNGAPITGLPASAFQVFEHQKKKLKVAYFDEISGATIGDEPLSLIVFVDAFNLRAANRDRALAELAGPLRALLEATPIPTSVVSFDGDYEEHQERTLDVEAVMTALTALQGEQAGDQRIENRLRGAQITVQDTLRRVRGSAQERRVAMASIESLFAELRGYGETIYQDTQKTLSILSTLVRAQAMEPGRKAVLYLSDGFALRPFDQVIKTLQGLASGDPNRTEDPVQSQASEDVVGSLSDGAGVSRDISFALDRGQQDLQKLNATAILEGLTGEANTYRVSFYPVKAPPGTALGAESRDRGRAGGARLSDLREVLETLAEATGGRAHTTESDLGDLVRALAGDFDHYYSLGITPRKKANGDYTPLRVKVKARGGRVRYRASYVQRPFEARLADQTLSAMLLGTTSNPHRLEAKLTSQTEAGEALRDVQITLLFPIEAIGLAEAAGVHSADARIAVVVIDGFANVIAGQHVLVPLRIPDSDLEAARAQFYRALVELTLPPGRHQLGLGLWDGIKSEGSFIQESLRVGGG